MKGIWLFHVSVMVAHLVLISALQSHFLVQLKLLSMWVQYINGRLKEKSLRAYLLYVMVFMPLFVWIKFTVCTGFPRYKCVTLLYTFTNRSIHHLLLHLTMLIGLTIKCRWTPMDSSPSNLHLPLLLFVHSHFSVLHWLLLTGKTLTCVGVETFSTGRHPMFPWYKEFETNFRTYFHLQMTSLLPGFSLQPGTGYLDVFRDLVWYVDYVPFV